MQLVEERQRVIVDKIDLETIELSCQGAKKGFAYSSQSPPQAVLWLFRSSARQGPRTNGGPSPLIFQGLSRLSIW